MTERIVPALLLASIFAFVGVKIKGLSVSGGFAAMIIGSIIYIFGGFLWAIVLIFFFVSSSLFSFFFKEKKQFAELKYAKGSKRDAQQVIANGGLGAIFSIFAFIFPEQLWPWWGFLTAIATVTADTWATEIGVLSKRSPVSIRNFKNVEKGTSGGISSLGLISAFMGAFAISLFDLFSIHDRITPMPLIVIAILGWIGALIDSWLGATVQVIYYDKQHKTEVEKPPIDGSDAIRGWRWMNNDFVNFTSALIASILAILIL